LNGLKIAAILAKSKSKIMENLKFKTAINATREKVWNSLFEDENYRE